MGDKPNPVICGQFDNGRVYIAEIEAYWGGFGVTGCSRPYAGNLHLPIWGGGLNIWVCGNLDCIDGWQLLAGWGDAQRLVKVFGPYIDINDAWDHMW